MDIADANSPEGLWGAIVDLLETFQQEAATTNVDFLLLGLQGSINAAAQERTPKAVWKKLIADDEVPFHLSVLSCAEECQQGSQTLALSALATFLNRAIADGILDTATNKQSSLTASMQQQFARAELLLNLPCLFMDAMDTLSAGAEPDGGPASFLDALPKGLQHQTSYLDPLSKPKALLQVYHRLQHVWPSGVFTSDAAATAAAPAGELALAVLRYMPHAGRLQSSSNSQQPGGKEAAPPFWGVHALEKAVFVLHQISVTRFGGRMPSQGPARIPLSLTDIELMRSPSYLPGLGVLLCTMAYSLLIQHNGSVPGLLSNSCSASAAPSSSTIRSDTMQQDAPASGQQRQGRAGKPLMVSATAKAGQPEGIMKAWEGASWHSQLLPASQQLLFKLLDVEARVVLWAASCRLETAQGHNVSGPIAMLRSYLDFANAPAQQRLRSAEHEAQLQEQLACLALFGLYWASYQPLTDSDAVDACEAAAAVGLQVLKPRLQQAEQHRSADPAAAQQQLGALLVVQEALTLLPHVLSRLVPKEQQAPSSSSSTPHGTQDLAATPAGSTRQAGSSAQDSSNDSNTTTTTMSSSSSTATADASLAGRRRAALEQLLGVLLGAAGGWLQPESAAVTSQQQTSAQQQSAVVQDAAAGDSEVRSAPAGTPTVASKAKALWAQHAASLAAQLEAFIRSSAASSAFPTGPLLLARESVLCAVAALCRRYAGAAEGCLVTAAAAAGPGSAADTKLVGLMCSLLKYHNSIGWQQYRSVQLEQQQQQGVISSPATDLLAVVASTATAMLAAAVAAATSNKPTAAGGVRPTKQLRRAVRVLPWLALFGRCCLQWSGQLQQLPASALSAQPPANHSCHLSAERALHFKLHDAGFCVLLVFQAHLEQWLEGCGINATRLAAAGYPVKPVLQQVDAATTALTAVWTDLGPVSPIGTDRMSVLVDAMESLGQCLCALPVAKLCNNPACGSVFGPSETAAVSGRNCVCGACRVAHYCCRGCQKQHWEQHKLACKAMIAVVRPH